jgi:hypothetical protein
MSWERAHHALAAVTSNDTTEVDSTTQCTTGGERTVYVKITRTGGDDTADTLIRVYDTPDPEADSPDFSALPYVDLRMPAGAGNRSMGFSFKAVPGFKIGLSLSAAEVGTPIWTPKIREG